MPRLPALCRFAVFAALLAAPAGRVVAAEADGSPRWLAQRVGAPAMPGSPRLLSPATYGAVVVPLDRHGHYSVQARVNNLHSIEFIIDTGASVVLLGRNHAETLRIYPRDRAQFSLEARTANGMIKLAPVTLSEIRIDRLSVAQVPALISEHEQEVALLGMNFLRQLRRFEVRNGDLVLE